MILVGGRNYIKTFSAYFEDLKSFSLHDLQSGNINLPNDDLVIFLASPSLAQSEQNQIKYHLDAFQNGLKKLLLTIYQTVPI